MPEPATIYRGIKALPRGHLLSVTPAGMRLRRYENRFNRTPLLAADNAATLSETKRVVEAAVKSRLLSDVPVGSFLSGGLDSSIVATVAAAELPSLDTFSVGFDDVDDPYHGRADESAAAAATARVIGARHHPIRVSAKSFRNELDTFCRHGDQPFAVSSGLGILAVAKAAQEAGIKVLLSGDGADECFGGYSWYSHLDAVHRNGATVRPGVLSFQNFGIALPQRLAAIAAMPASQKAWAWHYYAHEDEKKGLFAGGFGEGLGSSLRHFAAFRADPAWQPIDFIAQDRDFYFPNEMLRKVDRMTMAYSVEGARTVRRACRPRACGQAALSRHGRADGSLENGAAAGVRRSPAGGCRCPAQTWLQRPHRPLVALEWSDLVDRRFRPNSALSASRPDRRPGAGQVLRDDAQ